MMSSGEALQFNEPNGFVFVLFGSKESLQGSFVSIDITDDQTGIKKEMNISRGGWMEMFIL